MTWNRYLLKAKIKALAAHLSISAVLVGVALALMLFRWFPAPLFATDGGGIGLKLLLLVDLVLGPLLTFVVFNPQKSRREMTIDLGVIALLQLGAYGYGLHNIHSVRVVAVALHQGAFHTVTAPPFQQQTVPADSWQPFGEREPYLVTVREPAGADETSGVVAYGLMSGLEPYQLQFLYEPLSRSPSQTRDQGWTLAALQSAQPEIAVSAQRWLREHGEAAADGARFYRVEGYYGNAVLVLDEGGRWLGGFEGELPKLKPFSASPKS